MRCPEGSLETHGASEVTYVSIPSRRPYSVVVLDEIEKAHSEAMHRAHSLTHPLVPSSILASPAVSRCAICQVLNLLLQVLEDGRLTDGKAETYFSCSSIPYGGLCKGRTVSFSNSIIARGSAVPHVMAAGC